MKIADLILESKGKDVIFAHKKFDFFYTPETLAKKLEKGKFVYPASAGWELMKTIDALASLKSRVQFLAMVYNSILDEKGGIYCDSQSQRIFARISISGPGAKSQGKHDQARDSGQDDNCQGVETVG